MERLEEIFDRIISTLIDIVDSDIPYCAFCAILARVYWML
nr:MAG TPA: hypothetical protein [Caudoviricetes sp.]